ncbi:MULTISPECIES: hypothetical protein [Aurantimonas]|jgi:hypothetical protein|uniref:hypothetical protein n=1 Tax=Aurantimonas TaxID=182269 RepID=UPI003517BAB3
MDLSKFITPIVRRTVLDTIEARLPAMIESHLSRRFAEAPNLPLTNTGFRWAFFLALRSHWPDIDLATSSRWLADYIGGETIGSDAEQTPSAAAIIARDYVDEFGEHQS